ncbi:MAG: T9SS type A sorting domain-containing protein [Hymenobacter sp.]|nr:MAG: T9SS type A sorting domain-containing protein [Hymenobacter sp.]
MLAYGSAALAATASQANSSGVQLYPNPATTELRVVLGAEWPADTRLTVRSATGQQVAAPVAAPAAGSGGQRILSLGELPAGLYLLQAQRPGASCTLRFVKQ